MRHREKLPRAAGDVRACCPSAGARPVPGRSGTKADQRTAFWPNFPARTRCERGPFALRLRSSRFGATRPYLGCYNLDYASASDGLGFLLRRGQCRQEDRCQASNNGDDNEQFDQRKSLSPRLGFRERVSGSVFGLRFHFFGSIILSAAEISSKVGAFHRRTAPSLALAR